MTASSQLRLVFIFFGICEAKYSTAIFSNHLMNIDSKLDSYSYKCRIKTRDQKSKIYVYLLCVVLGVRTRVELHEDSGESPLPESRLGEAPWVLIIP